MIKSIKKLYALILSYDVKFQKENFIKKSEFMSHFGEFPRFAKFMWFGLERNGDYDFRYEYKGIGYLSLEHFFEANPDNDPSIFAGFSYIKKSDKILVPYPEKK